MRLSWVLVAGGFVVCLLAFFPLAIADWLPRSIQLIVGALALIAGVCLVELEARLEALIETLNDGRSPTPPESVFVASRRWVPQPPEAPTRPSPTQASIRDPRPPKPPRDREVREGRR